MNDFTISNNRGSQQAGGIKIAGAGNGTGYQLFAENGSIINNQGGEAAIAIVGNTFGSYAEIKNCLIANN